MCMLAVQGHPQQESLIDSQRIQREANTRANKCPLVQSELHVLTQLCQQLCSKRRLPLGSPAINEQSSWKVNKNMAFISIRSCFLTSFRIPHFPHTWPNEPVSLETLSLPTNPEKVYWSVSLTSCLPVLTEQARRLPPRQTPYAFKAAHIAAWCNAAACTSKAKGYAVSRAGSNTAGK